MSSTPRGGGPLRAWARLLRLPNLLTVPGDPLAGYALAAGGALSGKVWVGVAAALLLYASGLLFNDLFDREEDACDRPERPLPSGAADARTVAAVAALLMAGAVALVFLAGSTHAGLAALLLAGLILAYDAGGKRHPAFGPLLMGLCRGASLLLGAVLAGWPIGVEAAIAVGVGGLYIAVVTYVAEKEMQAPSLALLSLPASLFVLVACLSVWLSNTPFRLAIYLFFLSVWMGQMRDIRRIREKSMAIPPLIGSYIRALLPMQVLGVLWFWPKDKIAHGAGILAAFALAYLLATRLARRVPMS